MGEETAGGVMPYVPGWRQTEARRGRSASFLLRPSTSTLRVSNFQKIQSIAQLGNTWTFLEKGLVMSH